MNALFGGVIKVFLALVQPQYALGQDDGNGAQWRHTQVAIEIVFGGHIGSYRLTDQFSRRGCLWRTWFKKGKITISGRMCRA